MASTNLPVVAVAGGTGTLGQHITNALLSPEFRQHSKEIILLSRKSDLKVEGATVRTYTESNITEALKDVNIVINAIGSKNDPTPFKHGLIHAIATTPSVHLYLPSEFGVDHTIGAKGNTPHPDFDHIEWNKKKNLTQLARDVFAQAGRTDVKICHVFVGLFTESSIGPWFGLDTKNRWYEAVGNPDQKASFTGTGDIGRAVAAVATRVSVQDLPEYLRISGDEVSVNEIARLMDQAAGDSAEDGIKIETLDEKKYKEKVSKRSQEGGPAEYLRFLIGNGGLDFGKDAHGNNNELVNPGQKLWKWKTMKDYAEETKGRPWC